MKYRVNVSVCGESQMIGVFEADSPSQAFEQAKLVMTLTAGVRSMPEEGKFESTAFELVRCYIEQEHYLWREMPKRY